MTQTNARDLGRLLSDSFAAMREGWMGYAAIILFGIAPGLLLKEAASMFTGLSWDAIFREALGGGTIVFRGAVFVITLTNVTFSALASMALIRAIAARSEGKKIVPAQAFSGAVPYIGPWLFTWVPMILRIMIGFLPAVAVTVFLMLDFGTAAMILDGLCMLFGVCWAVIWSIRYSFWMWAVVLEGRSGNDALRRSRDIVVAHMGKVFGTVFASYLVGYLAIAAALLPLAILFFAASAVFPGAAVVWSAFTNGLWGLIGRAVPWSGPVWLAEAMRVLIDLITSVVAIWATILASFLYQDLSALHPSPPPH